MQEMFVSVSKQDGERQNLGVEIPHRDNGGSLHRPVGGRSIVSETACQ